MRGKMRQSHPSIYRDALKISPDRIAKMNEQDLNKLMTELLMAHSYRCECPLPNIYVNTDVDAPDDGCDGWTEKPQKNDDWFGETATCWQFKAGSAGIPSKLNGEVSKPIPMKTLKEGGRFVVVACGSTSGKRGQEARKKILQSEAKKKKTPSERIEVIGSESLANWCNQHPAVAARWAGRPEGLLTLNNWENSPLHQVPWQASESILADIADLQTSLDFKKGSNHHLHIQGAPGVGKTRFALELCRGAAWRNYVIYGSSD